MLINQIEDFIRDIQLASIEKSKDKAAEVEQFRIKYLGKKGVISDLFEQFKSVPNEQKKEIGQALNRLKTAAQAKIEEFKQNVENTTQQSSSMDLTMPTDYSEIGSRHVLSVVMNEIIEIFSRIGFTVAESVEIEDDWHLFSALNFPHDHPFAHTYFFCTGTCHGKQQTAYPYHCPGTCLPQRGNIGSRPLYIPSGGSALCRQEGLFCRLETNAALFRKGNVRRKNADPPSPVVLPVYGAFRRNGYFVQYMRWQGL